MAYAWAKFSAAYAWAEFGLRMGRIRPMHGQNMAYAWAEFGLCMGQIISGLAMG